MGGGRSLYMKCVGSGRPTVVLEGGLSRRQHRLARRPSTTGPNDADLRLRPRRPGQQPPDPRRARRQRRDHRPAAAAAALPTSRRPTCSSVTPTAGCSRACSRSCTQMRRPASCSSTRAGATQPGGSSRSGPSREVPAVRRDVFRRRATRRRPRRRRGARPPRTEPRPHAARRHHRRHTRRRLGSGSSPASCPRPRPPVGNDAGRTRLAFQAITSTSSRCAAITSSSGATDSPASSSARLTPSPAPPATTARSRPARSSSAVPAHSAETRDDTALAASHPADHQLAQPSISSAPRILALAHGDSEQRPDRPRRAPAWR